MVNPHLNMEAKVGEDDISRSGIKEPRTQASASQGLDEPNQSIPADTQTWKGKIIRETVSDI
jgi:hypothetical protein